MELYKKIRNLSKLNKILLFAFADLIICILSLQLSYLVRLEYFFLEKNFYFVFSFNIISYYAIAIYLRFYEISFSYIAFNTISKIFFISCLYMILNFTFFFITNNFIFLVPRSIPVIFSFTFFFLIIASRLIVISFLRSFITKRTRCIILGVDAYKKFKSKKNLDNYFKIYGIYEGNKSFKDKKKIDIKKIKKIISKNNDVRTFVVNNYNDIYKFRELSSIISVYFIKIISIKDLIQNNNLNYHDEEFEYFFSRKESSLNFDLNSKFKSKNILISGGAGTIGSSLLIRILNTNFKKIFILDNSEYNIWKLKIKLINLDKKLLSKIKFELIDISNKEQIKNFFKNKKNIDIIFHAAAFKHVNISQENIKPVIKNNVLSTLNLLLYSQKNNLKFVLVSTDKAIKPKNIMGISKRLCEKIVLYYQNINSKNSYKIVRFGNVFNSSGSLLETIRENIKNRQNITLDDPRMTRYFMSRNEAAELILYSCFLENKKNKIFLLNMGSKVKIKKLIINYLNYLNNNNPNLYSPKLEVLKAKSFQKIHELITDSNLKQMGENNLIYEQDEKKVNHVFFKSIKKLIKNIYNFDENRLRNKIIHLSK